jgi:hypothetical protein
MSQLLTDPASLGTLLAQEGRRRAQRLEDPDAKAIHFKTADKNDLAARASEWMANTEDIPQFLNTPMVMRLVFSLRAFTVTQEKFQNTKSRWCITPHTNYRAHPASN